MRHGREIQIRLRIGRLPAPASSHCYATTRVGRARTSLLGSRMGLADLPDSLLDDSLSVSVALPPTRAGVFLDPDLQLAQWRLPTGMRAQVLQFRMRGAPRVPTCILRRSASRSLIEDSTGCAAFMLRGGDARSPRPRTTPCSLDTLLRHRDACPADLRFSQSLHCRCTGLAARLALSISFATLHPCRFTRQIDALHIC